MSVWICSDKTISVLSKAYIEYDVKFRSDYDDQHEYNEVWIPSRLVNIGCALRKFNEEAYTERYGVEAVNGDFVYDSAVKIDEGVVYGCLRCYNYQVCEKSGYEESEIYRSLMRLQDKLIKRLIYRCGQKIPWGYEN